MTMSPRRLFLVALAPLAASVVVLSIAPVGRSVWIQQGCAVGLAGLVALIGWFLAGRVRTPAVLALAVALAGLAAPLLVDAMPPRRWIPLGPVRLYMAPLLLPLLLLVHHLLARAAPHRRTLADATVVLAGTALALQPDASQVLALLAAVTVSTWRRADPSGSSPIAWGMLALACAWAFSRPDPLQPVPHVEGVVSLAFTHAATTGLFVVAAELALVVGLWRTHGPTGAAMQGMAAYYAVLFGCAHAGLTPAPLIGYGAAPWLGYGLLAAAAHCLALPSAVLGSER